MSNNKNSKPKFFYCYFDKETILNHLSDQQAGKLWKLLFAYASRGDQPEIDNELLAMAFDVMIGQIDRDFEKYSKKCETNRANARSRTKTTADHCKPSQAIANDGSQEEEKEEEKEEQEKKEKENKKENVSSSTRVDARKQIDCEDVINSFNSICESLPNVVKVNKKRKQNIARAAEIMGDITFEELFQRIEKSDYLSGRKSDWICSFDWILNPDNLTKILEGNYDNRISPGKTRPFCRNETVSYDLDEYEKYSILD